MIPIQMTGDSHSLAAKTSSILHGCGRRKSGDLSSRTERRRDEEEEEWEEWEEAEFSKKTWLADVQCSAREKV